MKNTPLETYKPDSTIEGVVDRDINDAMVNIRHLATSRRYAAPVFAINYEVTTGAALIKIFDANAPCKLEVLDVVIQPRGASTNGTMKITDGTNDITNAMTCAVDKTIARAGTVDNAYSQIAANGTLAIVCAGDTIGNTIGLVTIIAVKKD